MNLLKFKKFKEIFYFSFWTRKWSAFKRRYLFFRLNNGKILYRSLTSYCPPKNSDYVNLFYWSWEVNFGDDISPIIIRVLSGKKVRLVKGSDITCRLLAVGSILHFAKDGDIVWGSGLRQEATFTARHLDIRAVRGPLTRKRLLEAGLHCPEVYGDPAILLPYIFKPRMSKKFEIGIIPHYKLARSVPLRGKIKPNVCFIDVSGNPLRVIEEICQCRYVLSSSLHGIIVAESYGIPAAWLRSVDISKSVVTEPDFKYKDYFISTKRSPVCYSYSDAIDLEDAIEFLKQTTKPELNAEQLLLTFPFLRDGINRLEDLEKFEILSKSF